MSDIRVPKLSNNDTEYVLVEWAVEDGKPEGPTMVELRPVETAHGVAMRIDVDQSDRGFSAQGPENRVCDGMVAAD